MKKLILMAIFGLFVNANTHTVATPVNITVVGAPAGYLVQTHQCANNSSPCTQWSTPVTIAPTVTGGNIYSIDTSASGNHGFQYIITLNGTQISSAYEPSGFANKTTWTLTTRANSSPVTYTDVLSGDLVNITVVGAPAGYIVQTHSCSHHQGTNGSGNCTAWTTPVTVNPKVTGGNVYSIDPSAGADVQYLIMLNGGQIAYDAPVHFTGKTTWTLTPNQVTYNGVLS